MLTVVGGIGNVAGALMGGILAGLRLPGPDHHVPEPEHGPRRRGLLERHGQPGPGGAGADRRQPGPQPERGRRRRSWRATAPLWRVKGVLALGVVAEVVAYLLVLTKVMGNWWFVLATALIVLALPALGRAGAARGLPRRGRSAAPAAERAGLPRSTAPVMPAVEGVADARP